MLFFRRFSRPCIRTINATDGMLFKGSLSYYYPLKLHYAALLRNWKMALHSVQKLLNILLEKLQNKKWMLSRVPSLWSSDRDYYVTVLFRLDMMMSRGDSELLYFDIVFMNCPGTCKALKSLIYYKTMQICSVIINWRKKK